MIPLLTVLPEWILHTDAFQILATFVAINSLMYATLAVLKVLPRGYGLARFNGRNRRRANRSIYPDQPAPDSSDRARVKRRDPSAGTAGGVSAGPVGGRGSGV
jgi:hypothetical protein